MTVSGVIMMFMGKDFPSSCNCTLKLLRVTFLSSLHKSIKSYFSKLLEGGERGVNP